MQIGFPSINSTVPRESAQRLLRSAQRGISSVAGILGTAPTYTQATVSTGPSTINASATTPFVTTGSILVTDARVVPIGGPFALISAPQQRIQGVTNTASANRVNGFGAGIRFAFFGQAFDFSANFYGGGWCCYVTDPTTGVRARTQAADYVDNAGFSFHKLDFGSAAYRVIEIYGTAANNAAYTFGAINIGNSGNALQGPIRYPDEARIGVMWDSWGQGILSSGTNSAKLGVIGYLGQAVGCANPLSLSVGGTGFLATNGGAGQTYRSRFTAGDFDVSRVGGLDAVIVSGSLNDFNLSGNTPAATQSEIALTLPAARIAQPNAIIVVTGPEITTASAIPQSWFDAHSAAFTAWGDSNSVYLDNSPNGESWLNANINAATFTGTQNHVNDVGKAYYGFRMGQSLIVAIRAKYGL